MKTMEEWNFDLQCLLAEREQILAAEAERECDREPEAPAETDEEWIERHGGQALRAGACVLCANGALIHAAGRRHGPALEEWAVASRLKSLQRLAVEQLQQSERDFRTLKNAASGRTIPFSWGGAFTQRYGPAPDARDRLGRPAGKAALLQVRNVVHRHRAALAEIERQIAELPEEQGRAAMLAEQRRSAFAGAELQAEVDAITL